VTTEQQRCQIRSVREPATDSGLQYHAANAWQLPACGTPVLPWHGQEMQAVAVGPGEVTCQRCSR
jgi:hypothetical protein